MSKLCGYGFCQKENIRGILHLFTLEEMLRMFGAVAKLKKEVEFISMIEKWL
jgi:hypothetical protein